LRRADRKLRPFDDRLLALADRLEGSLVRVTAVLALLVLAVQVVLTYPDARRWLCFVDRLEGSTIALSRPGSPGAAAPVPTAPAAAAPAAAFIAPKTASVTLALTGTRRAASVTVLVNGDPAGTLRAGLITVNVASGDLLEIDPGSSLLPVTIKVTAARSVVVPAVGATVTAHLRITRIGRVLTTAENPPR
jgi:hypothetical protein